MTAVSPGERALISGQSLLLLLLYVFLYFPIFYIAYLSFMENSVWPFPPEWTFGWYRRLQIMSDFHEGLANSILLGLGSGAIATFFAAVACIGLLKYPVRWRGLMAIVYLAPLFVAHVLIGIASLMFNRGVLEIPGNLFSAMVFGARPLRCFWEVTLPNIWPAVLGAFLVSFILAFNNLEISFYNLGAVPTLPTIAWGTLRHGIEPELYALASLVNGFVFVILITLYFLARLGFLRLGVRG
jgi:ABC-type spermidine/putrescine transport system permease subunit II